MASVSSLDQDIRKLRLDRVTPQAEEEVRAFIQASLVKEGLEIDRNLVTRLGQEKLFEFLGDGVCLCRLAERATSRSIRYAQKPGLFQARENIATFTELCKKDPINLHSHDTFLTVDLVESKDLAQVLQCIGAFSRAAHRLQPSIFPTQIGGSTRKGVMSPQGTGTPTIGGGIVGQRPRGISNTSSASSAAYTYGRPVSLTPTRTGELNSGRWSPTKPNTGSVSSNSASSWINKSDRDAAAPAWNEFQYGSVRGSNQGNLGVAFGSHRQIISASPTVPNMAEKERARRQKQEEDERLRREAEDAERERLRIEEEQAQAEEARRLAEEIVKMRDQEREKVEAQRQQWDEDDRRWQLEDERRAKEDADAEAKLKEVRGKFKGKDNNPQIGQSLSENQKDIQKLERQLEEARERERKYNQARSNLDSRQPTDDHERIARRKEEGAKARSRSRSRPRAPSRKSSIENWRENDERDYLRLQWSAQQQSEESNNPPPPKSPRPLPEPIPPVRVKTNHTGPSSRPLPDPTKYASSKEPPRTFQSSRILPDTDEVQSRATHSKEPGSSESITTMGSKSSTQLTLRERQMEAVRERHREEERESQRAWEAKKLGVSRPGGPRPLPR